MWGKRRTKARLARRASAGFRDIVWVGFNAGSAACGSVVDVQQFDDAVEVFVGVETDGEGAFAALGAFDFDSGLEVFFESVASCRVGGRQFVAALCRFGGGGVCRFDELLGLVDGEVPFDDGM